ncbi:DoxX family protein [Bradyrhizobium sp. LHD-71]|uniref:DoxX family protein n=1 Tax=Bradyrhizobium sp. LHD-71 TaxID=3072141 RepID=UPI00280CDE1B|nr:DoxX family protein [Bradyrhizobium sp. LHD-71]MDQ8732236.1 DoxX family protein [Bradyrhizobium sp. LHD-71]
MPTIIGRLLDSKGFALLARIILTFPFWASGLAKSIDFEGGVAEMAHFGLHPPTAYNIATIICQLGGSLLVILNRYTWLGAGALAAFTALTIPIAHAFWTVTGEQAQTELFFVVEHIGLIGGLMLVSILSRQTLRGGA